jgi:hypothetical protein
MVEKHIFDNAYLYNLLFYTQIYILWSNQWCSIILWYHQRGLLHSWSLIVNLRATIATYLWAKLAKNGWKQVIDDNYFYNLSFYSQICLMGQLVVFSYPVVSIKEPNILLTPNNYPMSYRSHSFKVEKLEKIRQKWLKICFCWYFQNLLFYTSICSIGQQVVFSYPMVSPNMPTTLTTPYSYPMGHHSHSFVIKCQK